MYTGEVILSHFFVRQRTRKDVNIVFLNDIVKKECQTKLTLEESYRFWRNILFEKICRIFIWDGLPFPQKELETRLMLEGFVGVVNDANKGIMCSIGSMSGATQYWDEFVYFTYSAPTARGGTKKIGKDCAIISSDSLRNGGISLVDRYALLLAHLDITFKMNAVNMRYKDMFTVENSVTLENVKTWRKQIFNGNETPVLDKSLIDGIKNMANSMPSSTYIKDIWETREDVLRCFYTDIGMKTVKQKKEREIQAEVNADSNLLLFNTSDMLYQREQGATMINDMFGLNVSVKLSPAFNNAEEEERGSDINVDSE